MRQVFLLLLFLTSIARAAETPAQANKRLYDATVDELNFRTFETVYDKSFTRGKFPVTLRTAQARKQFDQFGDNKPLKQLFQNYNAIAERYKNRFGNGSLALAEFERQLNNILLDKNFEFFIRSLPRDERVALIRAEQRLIKQASARFNAAGETSDTSPQPTAEAQAEEPLAAPLTTNDDGSATPPELRSEEGPALPEATAPSGPAPRHDWLDYFTLLFSLANALMLVYLITNALPAIRNRINRLAANPEPEEEPTTARSLLARMRPPRPADNYRDDRYPDDHESENSYDDETQTDDSYPDDDQEPLPRR